VSEKQIKKEGQVMVKKRTWKRWRDLEKETFTPERLEQLRQQAHIELLVMDLRELRKLSGKTQREVEEASEIVQSEISKLEHRRDFLLSTLRRYVHALGGELEIVVNFGNKSIRLKDVGDDLEADEVSSADAPERKAGPSRERRERPKMTVRATGRPRRQVRTKSHGARRKAQP